MYETMRDQKTVTIADDTVIQKLRKMGFPRQGRPLDNVVGEMRGRCLHQSGALAASSVFRLCSQPCFAAVVGGRRLDRRIQSPRRHLDGEFRRQLPGAGNHPVAVPADRLPPNSGRTVCLRWFHRQPDSAGGCPPCHAGGNRIQQRCGLPFGTGAFFYPESTADHGADQGADPHDPL